MSRYKYLFQLSLILLGLTFSACKKTAGEGGNGLISGSVMYKLTTHNGKVYDTVPAYDHEVLISYDINKNTHHDNTETGVNGHYEFNFLRRGNYRVTTFEDCFSCPGNEGEISKIIELNKSNLTKTDNNFYLTKEMDYDDGFAIVKGRVYAQRYVGTIPVGDLVPYQEQEVYIAYEDEVYFDRMDLDRNGAFQFNNLIPGSYTVYVYSNCYTCLDSLTTVDTTFTIKDNNESILLNNLIIEKR